MYIITHLYVVKNFWSFEILKQFWNKLWIFKVLEFHTFNIMNVFLVWLIFLIIYIFFNEFFNIIWVLCKIDSFWHNRWTFLNFLN
jgi:hypothetical protein